MSSFEEIPLLDWSLVFGGPESRAKFISQLRSAMTEVGFLYLLNPPIDEVCHTFPQISATILISWARNVAPRPIRHRLCAKTVRHATRNKRRTCNGKQRVILWVQQVGSRNHQGQERYQRASMLLHNSQDTDIDLVGSLILGLHGEANTSLENQSISDFGARHRCVTTNLHARMFDLHAH
jgi:hypothetical protein